MLLVIKKLNLIVTELFTRGRKLNIYLVFITQPYFTFTMPKNIRLNSMNYFIMKIPNNLNKLYSIIHQILTLKTL